MFCCVEQLKMNSSQVMLGKWKENAYWIAQSGLGCMGLNKP